MKTLPFKDIYDLLNKVEQLKAIAREDAAYKEAVLNERGIPCKRIEFGVSVDLSGLTSDQVDFVNNLSHPLTEVHYAFAGVEDGNEVIESAIQEFKEKVIELINEISAYSMCNTDHAVEEIKKL